MTERLTLSRILLLIAYSGGMAGGQVLFKVAALRSMVSTARPATGCSPPYITSTFCWRSCSAPAWQFSGSGS